VLVFLGTLQDVHPGLHILNDLSQETAFAFQFCRVSPKRCNGGWRRTAAGWWRLAPQAEKHPLHRMSVPQDRFNVRQDIDDVDVQDLKLMFDPVRF
jgi:hypothetical protein